MDNFTEVKVVVSGTVFMTTKDTLLNAGYFQGIFELHPSETIIVIKDRSPKLFEHALCYMRDRMYKCPSKCVSELAFYGIDKWEGSCSVEDCFCLAAKDGVCASHGPLPLKLYLLTQTANSGWDTYDSCVVAAEDEEDAKLYHPRDYRDVGSCVGRREWVEDVNLVKAELIGTAEKNVEPGVVIASFNAG